MNIEVGKKYLRRDGAIVYIKKVIYSDVFNLNMYFDKYSDSYYENGSYWSDGRWSIFDLIEEVNDE